MAGNGREKLATYNGDQIFDESLTLPLVSTRAREWFRTRGTEGMIESPLLATFMALSNFQLNRNDVECGTYRKPRNVLPAIIGQYQDVVFAVTAGTRLTFWNP